MRHATERDQFGKPIARLQLVQELIADIAVDTDAARLLVWRAADLLDRGEPFGLAASKAKYFASETAVRAANSALQVFGGYGYIDEYPVRKVPARRPGDDPLRGHQPDPEAAHRPGRDRHQRLRLTAARRRVLGGPGTEKPECRVASLAMSKRTAKARLRAKRNKANHGRKPNRGRG